MTDQHKQRLAPSKYGPIDVRSSKPRGGKVDYDDNVPAEQQQPEVAPNTESHNNTNETQ